jgi:hypothetical protein
MVGCMCDQEGFMRNPSLSTSAAKKILKKLQREKSEAPNIDAKETLNLKQDGDRATFIRHIAALTNTGKKSYLLIGVEDKTWVLKGIPDDSPLQLVDVVQQQMNQILAKRLDPPMSVMYRIHNIDGNFMGVVEIEGTNPPYVVGMEEEKFGGGKTEGKPSYIYQGVIYCRRGTASVPVTRQNQIEDMFHLKWDWLEILMTLGFIGIVTGLGVGYGCSKIPFDNPDNASVLGGIWGMCIGWLFKKRLADAFGRFSTGCLYGSIKRFGGVFWGGAIGSFLSFTVVSSIFSGETVANNAMSTVLIYAPMTVVNVIFEISFFVVLGIVLDKAYKKGIIL